MSNYDELWGTTEPAEKKGFDPVPTGEYEAYVDQVTYDESKDPHRVSVLWKITGPSCIKRGVFSSYNMSAQGISFLKKDLALMEIEVKSFKTLPNDLQNLVGKQAAIYVGQRQGKDGKTYNSVFINENMGSVPHEMSSGGVDSSFDANEEIPF